MDRIERIACCLLMSVLIGCACAGNALADEDLTAEQIQARLDMMLIGTVLDSAVESLGQYPDSGAAVVRLDSVSELRQPPFDGRFSEEDPWGNPYLYLADEYDFAVLSTGADGQEDIDYEHTPMQAWHESQGDDVIISSDGWLKRSLTRKERQKRTMADLRSIATAIEEFSIDNDLYPTATTMGELEPQVVPTYIRTLPRLDGWGNPILVESNAAYYKLISLGDDGLMDEDHPGGGTSTYDSDIVFEFGSFAQWPQGPQR